MLYLFLLLLSIQGDSGEIFNLTYSPTSVPTRNNYTLYPLNLQSSSPTTSSISPDINSTSFPTLYPTVNIPSLTPVESFAPSTSISHWPTGNSINSLSPSGVPSNKLNFSSLKPTIDHNKMFSPSISPSFKPSNAFPILNPFKSSIQATFVPSNDPHSSPTAHPSYDPNSAPTVYPSNKPFSSPSSKPSHQPFSCPSISPSLQPSLFPTYQPSSNPTELSTQAGSIGTNGWYTVTTDCSVIVTKLIHNTNQINAAVTYAFSFVIGDSLPEQGISSISISSSYLTTTANNFNRFVKRFLLNDQIVLNFQVTCWSTDRSVADKVY